MTFNRMSPDALNHVVLGAGVIFSGDFPSIFELQDNADDSSILGATSGGVSVDLTPKITTFSGDDNARRDASYIRYDSWTAKLSCKMVTLSRALFEYALSGTESAAAVSQLEVIPQWCGVEYCYGGWQLVDAAENKTKDAEEEARVKSAAETEALLNEDDADTLENKVLVETERNSIIWEDIPWQILRDLRLSVNRSDDTIVASSEDWKVVVLGNSTLSIEISSPEDSIIQDVHTEISIGEGRYRFKPHTHTRLTLQAETGSVLMNERTTHTYTASILPAWNYTLDDEETEAEQSEEEEDSSKEPKEQYVWQILTYTGDPVDLEEVEGSKEPNEEEEDDEEEGDEEEEEEEEPEEDEDEDKGEDESEEQEQIAFTCGQTVTVRAVSPGTVVLRCTATRLDARESSDLIITVLPIAALYVKANSSAEASLVDAEDSSYVPFMVKDDTNGAGTLVFAEEAEAEDEEDDDSQVLEFVTSGDSDGGGGDDNGEEYGYFVVGSTSDAQSDVEETTKKLAEKYTGQMAKARQQVAAAEMQVDEPEKEYDETLEALEKVENESSWGNVSAVGGGGVSTVAQDVWWVGNYGLESDGSKYAAIHLKNATLTSGLKISSNDAKLAEVNVTFESAYDSALEDALPFEVYLSGEDEEESPEPEEGAEE